MSNVHLIFDTMIYPDNIKYDCMKDQNRARFTDHLVYNTCLSHAKTMQPLQRLLRKVKSLKSGASLKDNTGQSG